MSANVWPDRLSALDVSRAVASLGVVMFHWPHLAGVFAVSDVLKSRASQPFYGVLKLFYENGYMGVTYFFLLSGFIFFWLYGDSIRTKRTSLKVFSIQRFSRLYPLHLATLCIVAVLQAIYFAKMDSYFVYSYNDLYHFVLHLGFASAWSFQEGWSFNHPVWSVSIEVVLYGCFFVVCFMSMGRKYFCLFYSVVAMGLSPFFSNPIFDGASMFFFGGFVYQLISGIKTSQKKAMVIATSIAAGLWFMVLINVYVVDIASFLPEAVVSYRIFLKLFTQYCLFPSSLIALALLEIRMGNFLSRLGWVGNITYSTYLIHFPLMLLVAIVFSYGWLPENFFLKPAYQVAYFAILIPLSYAVYGYFERPMQSWIRSRFRK
jgi:peptidoglycan/LPS O-acetylase OafA/YrhL